MISVIIPLYNAENTILAALDSVKNQEGNFDFEIMVINDGSTDKSAEKVQQFIQENPQLNIQLIHQDNKGVSSARNAGLRLAKGEFIAFLDADDVWLPHKTKVMIKVLTENPEIDFLVALRNSERIWFPYKINYKNLAKITLNKLLFRIEGQTSTAIFKRKILINTGLFNENQKYSVTGDLMDLVNTLKAEGSKENEIAFAYMKFMTNKQRDFARIMDESKGRKDSLAFLIEKQTSL